MAEDAPDWHTLDWKVEATLRPTVVFPTGRVLLYEDFESPTNNWFHAGSGSAPLSTARSYSKTACLLLNQSTATPGGAVCSANRVFGMPPAEKIGIEMKFAMEDSGFHSIRVGFSVQTATHIKTSRVYYHNVDEVWKYYDSDGNVTEISGTGMNLMDDVKYWHFMKYTADIENNKYIDLKIDDHEFDIDSLASRSVGNVAAEHALLNITIQSLTNETTTAYIDDVVVTEE